jgi:hypothetical protein
MTRIAPCSRNGPTFGPTPQRLNGPRHSVTSCISTIITAATLPLGVNHPSVESTTCRVTTPSEHRLARMGLGRLGLRQVYATHTAGAAILFLLRVMAYFASRRYPGKAGGRGLADPRHRRSHYEKTCRRSSMSDAIHPCPDCGSMETPWLVVRGGGLRGAGISHRCRACDHEWDDLPPSDWAS